MSGYRTVRLAISCSFGLVVHELRWTEHLEKLLAFRRRMKAAFNLPFRAEIHSAHLINKPGPLVAIKRNDRLSMSA
jgi:hypothetical protein